MADQLESRVAEQVGYVGLEAGKVVVEADDLSILGNAESLECEAASSVSDAESLEMYGRDRDIRR